MINKNIVIPALMFIVGFGTDAITFFSIWRVGNVVTDRYFVLWGFGGVVALIGAVWLITTLIFLKTQA